MSKSSAQVSEIDRLIELASDEKSRLIEKDPVVTTRALSVEDQKDPRPSMWRLLLQLRVLLPYLSRVLPLLERGLLGTSVTGSAGSRVDTSHFDRGIAEIEGGQRDLSQQIKNQTGDIKFLLEQVGWLSKSLETATHKQEESAAALASLTKRVNIWAFVAVVLLVAVLGAELFLLLRVRS